ncbi:DUF3800 domain-containing protein [Leptospira interrogans]
MMVLTSLGLLLAPIGENDGPDQVIAVLRAYLDDSGTNKQSPIVVMGGYVASLRDWRRFESRARRIFRREGVDLLHAKDFHDRDGCFAGWSPPRQMCFVTDLYDAAGEANVLLGMAHAVTKDVYKQRGVETGLNKNTSAYGWCFQMLLNRLLNHEHLHDRIRQEGISFVLESGNPNNGDCEKIFEAIRTNPKYGLEHVLKSISFVPKNSCAAIQFADFIAFFNRRHTDACTKVGGPLETLLPYLEIATSKIRHDAFVATDFHAKDPSLTSAARLS